MDEKALGKRLQEARKAAGLTQQDLCHKANLSYSTLAKIERGAIKSPSIFTVQSIAVALGSTLDNLMGLPASPALDGARALARTKSGARFIYFDVNGCLVQFYHQAFLKLAEATSSPPDLVETAFWHFNDAICKGTMSMSDFNKALGERIGASNLDWQQFYLEAAKPVGEMHELLKWAVEHYKVGLLTNIMPGFVAAMREGGQIPNIPFDAIVDSSEVGTIKPEPKIYKIATERAGVAPNEIILIDDSRANLIAAEQAGWNVLWFDVYHSEESTGHIRAALEPAS